MNKEKWTKHTQNDTISKSAVSTSPYFLAIYEHYSRRYSNYTT